MSETGVVYIVDDDASIRALVEAIVRGGGLEAQCFASTEEFEKVRLADRASCILLDLEMPGTTGLEFMERRFKGELPCSVIVLTAHGSVERAVKSMKLGAVDFLQKPFQKDELLKHVKDAVERDRLRRAETGQREEVRRRLANLSPRERQLLAAVIEGKSTKMIADDLEISSRTVDHHRANLMEKMHAANVADLVRMAMEAGFEK